MGGQGKPGVYFSPYWLADVSVVRHSASIGGKAPGVSVDSVLPTCKLRSRLVTSQTFVVGLWASLIIH